MIQTLNKIAWISSIALWIAILAWFGWWQGSILLWVIFWAIIKKLFLSRSFISQQVEAFAAKIEKRFAHPNEHESEYSSTKSSLNYTGWEFEKASSLGNLEQISKESLDTEAEKTNIDSFFKEMTKYHNKWLEDTNVSWKKTAKSFTEEEKKKDYETQEYIPEPYSNTAFDDTIEKTNKYLKSFFSQNILAKLGSIFVFLGVIFLLSLIWDEIPAILKILMWFVIWVATYMTWVFLDRKWFIWESRILLGIAIAINFWVILAWRFIIWDTWIDSGSSSDAIFGAWITFVLLILNTLFAVITSLNYKSWELLLFSLLIAYINPFMLGQTDSTSPYILVGYSLIVSIWTLFLSRTHFPVALILMSFVFGNLLILVAPNLLNGIDYEIAHITKIAASVIIILGSLHVSMKLEKSKQYFVEILFSASPFVLWTFAIISWSYDSLILYILYIIIALLYSAYAYYFQNSWKFLYSIGTIGWVLLLSSQVNFLLADRMILSILWVLLFWAMNIYAWLRLKLIDTKDFKNFLIGIVSGAAFLAFSLYSFFTVQDRWFMEMGIGFLMLSLLYFSVWYFFIQKNWIQNLRNNTQDSNLVYSLGAVSLSFLTISTSLIFSDIAFVVPIIWLTQWLTLHFFHKKVSDSKVFIAACIMYILGLLEFADVIFNTNLEIVHFVPLAIIALIGYLGTRVIQHNISQNDTEKNGYYILHSIGLLWLISAIFLIYENTNNVFINFELFYLCFLLFFASLAFFYARQQNIVYNCLFIWLFSMFSLIHLWAYSFWDWSLAIPIWSTIILGLSALSYLKFFTGTSVARFIPLWVFAVYFMFISSIYVYDIFNSVFAITLYWWLLAFGFLSFGISKDKIMYRTIGLYVIVLLCLKIIFVDIASAIDDDVIKVIAFIGVWMLLIVVSLMYSRKYGNNLKWEFQFSNIYAWSKKHIDSLQFKKTLEDIDISGVEKVRFKPIDWKTFETKSKNLLRIVVSIMKDDTNKSFKASQLEKDYNFVIENYQSDLSKADYNRVKSVIHDFVKSWGDVEIKKK